MSTTRTLLVPCCLLLLTTACSSEEDAGDGGDDLGAAECPVVVSDDDCDRDQRPFVFVHGTYGSGDNFANVASLLGSNGFCQDRIYAFEYNSLGDQPAAKCEGDPMPQGCGKLDVFIDEILADTGFDKVDLSGHSQGTAHCGTYLADPAQAAKVAHYVNYSGSPDVGAVPTLSLSSNFDLGLTPHHATGSDVEAVTFEDEDHFAVASSRRAFVATYEYLKGEPPKYEEVQCGDEEVTVEGISETFADNQPVPGKLELREMTDTPRSEGTPVVTFDGAALPDGRFGPFTLKRGVAYELKGFDPQGVLIGYQYFTPFKRSNRLVRLLSPAFEGDGSTVGGVVAAASTDHVVRGPNHVALVARWAGGAFRHDLGARLTIDGVDVLASENAGADAYANGAGLSGGVVGFFMNDANENGASDLGLYHSGPFISFTDVFIGTDTPKISELRFTAGSEDPSIVNQKVRISNWPSSDAQVLVMFQ